MSKLQINHDAVLPNTADDIINFPWLMFDISTGISQWFNSEKGYTEFVHKNNENGVIITFSHHTHVQMSSDSNFSDLLKIKSNENNFIQTILTS